MKVLFQTMTRGVIAIAIVALGAVGMAAAQDDPANIVKYRILLMNTQTGHLRAIAAVVKGEVSYGAHVKNHADAIKIIGEMKADVWPPGSAVGESRAKPEIWQNWNEFQELYDSYMVQVVKLAEVSATGDLAAIGAQLGEVGNTCGACHNRFRKEK